MTSPTRSAATLGPERLTHAEKRIIEYADHARRFIEAGDIDNARAALRFAFQKAPVRPRSGRADQ